MPLFIAIAGIVLVGLLSGCKPKAAGTSDGTGTSSSAASATGSIDPAVLGLWAPDLHDNLIGPEYDFFPDGTMVQRLYDVPDNSMTALFEPVTGDGKWPYLRWTINGVIYQQKSALFGTANFANGSFTFHMTGTPATGTYAISADGRHLTLTLPQDNAVLKFHLVADAMGNPLPPLPPPAPTNDQVDPSLIGIWRESIPMPAKGYTQVTLFEFHPNGQFVAHIQHLTKGQSTTLNSTAADVETDPGTVRASGGRYDVTTPQGEDVLASYALSRDKQKLIVMYDTDDYGFLFEHLADITADDSISMTMSNGTYYKPPNEMDPALARVWMSSYHQHPADNFNVVTLLEWHADGNFEMHVRNVSPGQSPLEAKDTTTVTGVCDAFGGRFLLAEPDGGRETGVYSITGTQLNMAWDTEKQTTYSYQLYGSFDAKGNVVPLTAGK
jgi:hypothetical protein